MRDELSQLKNATISHHGTHVTVLFRDRDRMSAQFRAAVSYRMALPVQFIFHTQEQTRVEWWTAGVCYNPSGPSYVSDSQHQHLEEYHTRSGNEGRDGGPSRIDHLYRKHYAERWKGTNSFLNRNDGPATIKIQYSNPPEMPWVDWRSKNKISINKNYFSDSDMVTCIEERELTWQCNGTQYRKGSWAYQRDTNIAEYTGISSALSIHRTTVMLNRRLQWYDEENGELHRTDGPAMIDLTNVKEAEKDGKSGEWQYDGWKASWFIHGRHIDNLDVIGWARRNHIRMWDAPCYNKSIFRDSDGEFCFLTDFVKT